MMKKIIAFSLALFIFGVTSAVNQIQTSKEKSQLQLLSSKTNSIEFVNQVGDFSALQVKTKAGVFAKLRVPKYYP